MRYVLGPSFNHSIPPPDAPPPGAPVDMTAAVASVDTSGVSLNFVVPSQPVNVPAEVRIYLAPVGAELPPDADGWVASSFHASVVRPTIDPTTGGGVFVPMPGVDPGDYFGQVVVGYPV